MDDVLQIRLFPQTHLAICSGTAVVGCVGAATSCPAGPLGTAGVAGTGLARVGSAVHTRAGPASRNTPRRPTEPALGGCGGWPSAQGLSGGSRGNRHGRSIEARPGHKNSKRGRLWAPNSNFGPRRHQEFGPAFNSSFNADFNKTRGFHWETQIGFRVVLEGSSLIVEPELII